MPEAEEAIPFIPATEQPFASKPEPAGEPDGHPDEPDEQQPDEPAEEPENLEAKEGEAEGEPETDEANQESGEDDLEDFEWDGKTIRGPKGLKDAVLMQADYTRKTQEVAAQRKELEALEQSLKQRSEATEEEMNLRSEVWALETALKQYDNYDWAQWIDQDPLEAQKARFQLEDLRRRHGESKSKLTEYANKRSQDMQQDFAKRVGQTREFAKQNIKGFSTDMEKRVIDFARAQGITDAQLQASMSPMTFSILHKAMIGEQTLKNPAAPPQKQAVPLKTVSSRSNAPVRKALEDMNMDEYAKARQAQGYKPPM